MMAKALQVKMLNASNYVQDDVADRRASLLNLDGLLLI